ncbi:MAG: radical SAM protein [Thermoleophilia bacterium]
MKNRSATACGLLFCYNEEHILRETLKYYLSQGIDVVVADNCSTDSSPGIVQEFMGNPGRYTGRVIDTIRVETEGYEWGKILRAASDYMHRNLTGYDWILQIDADGFYQSPVRGMSLLHFMSAAQRFGYNIIDGKWFDFHPTEADDPSIESPMERIRYCRVEPYGPMPQHKIFRYHPSVDFFTSLGHECHRDRPRVAPLKYVYRHYPWVSYEHGVKKIFKDRKPRYIERKENPLYHMHYLELLPQEADLVKCSSDLYRFNEDEVTVSREAFYRTLFRDRLRPAVRTFQKVVRKGLSVVRRVPVQECPAPAEPEACSPAAITGADGSPAGARTVTNEEILARGASTMGFPHTFHFLMTTACNARCLFCNQDFTQPLNEITLEKFKQMTSHMPVESAKYFYLSGGGDPLLSRDFFPILKYINEEFPWINVRVRTNGLLLRKYAELLSEQNLRLELSVHGATDETNSRILGTKKAAGVFEGLESLNDILAEKGRQMDVTFVPALFKSNIRELPDIIRKAAELKVKSVESFFCRCYLGEEYKGEGRITEAESLYFSQEEYDEVIEEAVKVAASLGVCFTHEPRFSEEFHAKACYEPWKMLLVDWDGEVFPCCGGEMWFKKKVASGEYHFGNLLSEDLYQFWNNETYVAIRRTLSPHYPDNLVPECSNCHSLLCFEGPQARDGHIIDREPSPA